MFRPVQGVGVVLDGGDPEPGGGEDVSVFLCGAGIGDAGHPCGGSGQLVGKPVAVGGDVADSEPAARPQDSGHLSDRRRLVREGAQRAFTDDRVPAAVGQGQGFGVPVVEGGAVGQVGGDRCAGGEFHVGLGQVDAVHDPAVLLGGEQAGCAHAAGDIHQPLAGLEADRVEQSTGEPLPPGWYDDPSSRLRRSEE